MEWADGKVNEPYIQPDSRGSRSRMLHWVTQAEAGDKRIVGGVRSRSANPMAPDLAGVFGGVKPREEEHMQNVLHVDLTRPV